MSSRDHVLVGERLVRLDPRALVGEGGEGRVIRAGDLALKIFTTPTDARRRKLEAFPTRLPGAVVAPLALCLDPDTREIVGYAMRLVEGAVGLGELARRPFRDARASATDVLAVLGGLVRTTRQLHARGVVVGDLNDGNVLVLPPERSAPWQALLVDADSMQLPGHPCVVAHERFLDPRLYGVDLAKTPLLSRATDAYALAVLLFGALACVHPFGGTHPTFTTLLRRAEARVSVLSPGVKLPKAAYPVAIFSDAMLDFFQRVFEADHRDAVALVPDDLLATPFTRCTCGVDHARRTCPACTASALVRPVTHVRGDVRVTSILRALPGGRVIDAATLRGELLTLHTRGAGLEPVREDGARVPVELGHGSRVRLVGRATWVLGETHAERFELGALQERVPITRAQVYGEPEADACPAGLLHLEGDHLVRAWDGTRLGQLLAGRSWLRVGARVGFAFYRVSALTVAFVFDVRRGPLRQLEMPPLTGRLVRAHATFDDHHVLFRAVTEDAGRVHHVAHLFDGRGHRLASASGAEDASPLFAGGDDLEGACLLGGAVLVATPEGLALLRPDPRARVFETRRVFEAARDFASPDAALLVGRGGSVYVRTHDEIVLLGFTEAGGSS